MKRNSVKQARLYMDTVVEIQVETEQGADEAESAIQLAFEAFRKIEQACSRFSPDSELMLACRSIRKPVAVSPYVYEPLQFALELAEWTNGIFDPTIGRTLETYGFNRHYLTGEQMDHSRSESASYRDIVLDEAARTLLLSKPLVIDLGAVAKGFAIDMAAAELRGFERFAVNAGGDLFAGGAQDGHNSWHIGIRHPADEDRIIETVTICNEAICTSGSYARRSSLFPGIHHIVHPLTQQSPSDILSCTVIAPYAMLADAFSTAAFLLEPERRAALIEEAELQCLWITSQLETIKVGGVKA